MATTNNPTTTTTNNDEPEPTEQESKMTEAIAKDRPTIDAAVKSFISMVCAQSMAASSTDATHDKVMMGIIPSLAESSISENAKSNSAADSETGENSKKSNPNTGPSVQQQVLELARYILKAVNAYTFPLHDTVAYSLTEKPGTSAERKEELLEISVVARLWNALVQSEQKPSRFLGRRALKLAWKNLTVAGLSLPIEKEGEGKDENSNDVTAATTTTTVESDGTTQQLTESQLEWLQKFERLLFESSQPLPSDLKIDDDSALLWAPDGGAAELAKRRQRRLDAAKERGPSTPS